MTALMLDPHGDDAALFAAFTLMRYKPTVVVCLKSQLQEDRGTGITAATREAETAAALECLGVRAWEQWQIPDSRPDWVAVRRLMEETRESLAPTKVFAPAWEMNGHEGHNAITEIAGKVFDPGILSYYLTYERGSSRSDWATEVIPEPEWIAAKHRALACFTSQIVEPSTRPWFMDSLREWVA